MANELDGRTAAFLIANEGVEQVELTTPWAAILAAGGTPLLLAPEVGNIQAFNHLDKADTFPVDQIPDVLRTVPAAVRFVRGVFEAGKPAAAICHAPWTLVEADLVRGRTLTSWPSLRTDIQNAGGTWVDTGVQVDRSGPNVLITSRNPGDLPAFCRTLIEETARQYQSA
jgi:protease I